MNKTAKQNGAENSLKNLRAQKVQAKPVHIAVLNTVQSAVSFFVRSSKCDAASTMLAVKNSQAKSGNTERFAINEKGKWAKVVA